MGIAAILFISRKLSFLILTTVAFRETMQSAIPKNIHNFVSIIIIEPENEPINCNEPIIELFLPQYAGSWSKKGGDRPINALETLRKCKNFIRFFPCPYVC